MEANWNWQPQGSATKHASNIAEISSGHQHDMQGGRTPHGNKKFDLYVYTENSDGTGNAIVNGSKVEGSKCQNPCRVFGAPYLSIDSST